MFNDARADIFFNPWGNYTMSDFEAECTLREHKILVCAVLHSRIRLALFYDRRQNGSHGRSLRWAIKEYVWKVGVNFLK